MTFKQSWRLAGFGVLLLQGCYIDPIDLGYDDWSHSSPGHSSGGMTTGANNGGSGGSGGHGSCAPGTACGGDVVGSWAAASSCLDATGELDISQAWIGCSFASVTASLEVSGTWTAHADGTYEDLTTTSGEGELVLDEQCRNVSGVVVRCERLAGAFASIGFASVTCEDAANGGCKCPTRFEQTAGLGVLSVFPPTSGRYTLSDGVLATSEAPSATAYQYCVSGDALTLTPETTSPSTAGNIVFHRR
jgi:hypothetical protein